MPVVSEAPSLWVHVTETGSVVEAGGVWYAEVERAKAALVDFPAALDALKLGDGEFVAQGFQPFQEGVATVERAEMGYQLAYSLDYTPYLIPVAAFSGNYRAAGHEAVPFQAYVPLLEFERGYNAGNFKLETALPVARAAGSGAVNGYPRRQTCLSRSRPTLPSSWRPRSSGSFRSWRARLESPKSARTTRGSPG